MVHTGKFAAEFFDLVTQGDHIGLMGHRNIKALDAELLAGGNKLRQLAFFDHYIQIHRIQVCQFIHPVMDITGTCMIQRIADLKQQLCIGIIFYTHRRPPQSFKLLFSSGVNITLIARLFSVRSNPSSHAERGK